MNTGDGSYLSGGIAYESGESTEEKILAIYLLRTWSIFSTAHLLNLRVVMRKQVGRYQTEACLL